MKSIEATGKTVNDAIKSGLESLGVDRADVEIQVLEMGSLGIFGMFGKRAKVRLTVKADDPSLDIEMPVLSLDAGNARKPKAGKPKAEKPRAEKPAKAEAAEAETEEAAAEEAPKEKKSRNRRRRSGNRTSDPLTGESLTGEARKQGASIFEGEEEHDPFDIDLSAATYSEEDETNTETLETADETVSENE